MLLFEDTAITHAVDFNLINSKTALLYSYLNTSISEGTLRSQDLMPKFLDAAEAITKLLYLKEKNQEVLALREEWQDVVGSGDFGSAKAWFLCDELEGLLQSLAPEGFYFGSHPGDGVAFGFWKCI